MWRSSKGMTDEVVVDHACSGETCSYYQIGDVFICEKTGRVHVCDDTCREVVLDTSSGFWFVQYLGTVLIECSLLQKWNQMLNNSKVV
uniref:F-box protein SKIP31-like n=1 Tax=Nelumbo nucifera TaxID=4432 RepID=A0A822XSJ0_NELNU|nr:TPA_asm: hypothetical protein HUJ06_026038 [Nelumbo nucifera]